MLNRQKEFSLQIAEYTLTCSESICEIFKDSWMWEESVKSFAKWIQETKGEYCESNSTS